MKQRYSEAREWWGKAAKAAKQGVSPVQPGMQPGVLVREKRWRGRATPLRYGGTGWRLLMVDSGEDAKNCFDMVLQGTTTEVAVGRIPFPFPFPLFLLTAVDQF